MEHLLRLGASKDIADPLKGRTALGHYRFVVASERDFYLLGHYYDEEEEWAVIHQKMECNLLRPIGGETDAYRVALGE